MRDARSSRPADSDRQNPPTVVRYTRADGRSEHATRLVVGDPAQETLEQGGVECGSLMRLRGPRLRFGATRR